jgi:hypothetical protein
MPHHPAYHTHRAIYRATAALLALDACYTRAYVVVTVVAIRRADQIVETDGFLALGSPHSGIVPTLVAILASLRAALRDNAAGRATRPAVDPGWFLIPVMAVPYDALAVAQSFATKPFSLEGSVVFCYGACMSCLTAAFTTWLYVRINENGGSPFGHEIREGLSHLRGVPQRGSFEPLGGSAERARLRPLAL